MTAGLLQVAATIGHQAGNPPSSPPLVEGTNSDEMSVEDLLAHARGSGSRRTRNLGNKLAVLLADVTSRVRAELAAERARLELAAQEADLAQRLVAVRQELRSHGDHRVSTTLDVDPKVVRAWAAAQGIECAATGRVPQRVVNEWRAAMAGAGGSR